MRSGRWLHATVGAAAAIAVAGLAGAPQVDAQARPPARPGAAVPRPAPRPAPPPAPTMRAVPRPAPASRPVGRAAVPAVPRPAGSSPVESSDVPPWRPPPPRFAVAPFENRSGVRVFDWLVAGAPFEVSQKTEAVFGLEPTGGPLHVGAEAVAAEAGAVAAFAARRDAAFVITGWVERPTWRLRIAMSLWKVTGGTAALAAEAVRTGELKSYHQLLGEALGEVWSKGGGVAVDEARGLMLARVLSGDLYAVNLMGRGLGHLTGALIGRSPIAASGNGSAGGSGSADSAAASSAAASAATNSAASAAADKELRLAEHDLTRAVLIDPKCFEAQRLVGELLLSTAAGDPKLTARAFGKFNYAHDLAPDDLASLRAAAGGATQTGKHEAALALWRSLVNRRPWDLDARYELGGAMWRTGDPGGAVKQLEQVTAKQPDHLPARRVLALIHAARSDTRKLVDELEAIAARAPGDLEVKADLATAYGALSQWGKAVTALEAIAVVRPADVALQVRIGDARRKERDLAGALAAYARASKLAPDWSWPGFAAAQALFDAGRLTEANHAYTMLQRHREDLAAAEQALGVIALLQNRPDEAAWYLRRAVREAPRSLLAWRALIAAELGRKDAATAARDVAAALPTWPRDAELHYLAGVAHAMLDERAAARRELTTAAAGTGPTAHAARAALEALDAGASIALRFTPEIVRPWGDGDAIAETLERYGQAAQAMAEARARYQRHVLTLLGAMNRGPYHPRAKPEPVRRCPITRVAAGWAAAQRELRAIERLGVDLEAIWRFLARHDEVGATASLLPTARTEIAAARKGFRTALADIAELRAEWVRSLIPELRAAGCNDRLLAAAAADPARYKVVEEDRPESIPTTPPPRPRARATFYVDNTTCIDPVDVWIDGAHLGQVAPGRRSALVADGGERTLCLLVPGAPQCGDRGTLRQVYLHDGWSVTMHCPK